MTVLWRSEPIFVSAAFSFALFPLCLRVLLTHGWSGLLIARAADGVCNKRSGSIGTACGTYRAVFANAREQVTSSISRFLGFLVRPFLYRCIVHLFTTFVLFVSQPLMLTLCSQPA